MAKVLKITKADGTVHVVPVAIRAFYDAQNNRSKSPDDKVKIEEIDEAEAKDLPFIDDKFVKTADAVAAVDDLTKSNQQKDAEIEQLREQLRLAQQVPLVPQADAKADDTTATKKGK